jgi:hypothetical protein
MPSRRPTCAGPAPRWDFGGRHSLLAHRSARQRARAVAVELSDELRAALPPRLALDTLIDHPELCGALDLGSHGTERMLAVEALWRTLVAAVSVLAALDVDTHAALPTTGRFADGANQLIANATVGEEALPCSTPRPVERN